MSKDPQYGGFCYIPIGGPTTDPYRHELGKVKTRWVLISPELAAKYLAKNCRNRKVSEKQVDKYVADMEAGEWPVTHQGVAFNVDDELVDGQNRLHAIKKSGKSYWTLVTDGLPRKSMTAIDRGKQRTAAHGLQIIGHEMNTSRHVAIARRMCMGVGYEKKDLRLSDVRIIPFFERHGDAIRFAYENVGQKVAPASVAGCIARAFYSVDREELRRFCLALSDAVPFEQAEERDKSAAQLREFIISVRHTTNSFNHQNELYCKTQEAIKDFLTRSPKKKLRGRLRENIFFMPEDGKAEQKCSGAEEVA